MRVSSHKKYNLYYSLAFIRSQHEIGVGKEWEMICTSLYISYCFTRGVGEILHCSCCNGWKKYTPMPRMDYPLFCSLLWTIRSKIQGTKIMDRWDDVLWQTQTSGPGKCASTWQII